ncbi:haloacid dehalogenase type II [Pseudarthrobacter sp. H2]|uniref:haloacid dehalogenase type II n=1 Tax=Pseudarthrobacter sp. H2 TaxID=3418415 RepID=UPI003CED1BDD
MMSSPSVIVFDVNETLSDMSPMATRFAEVGAPEAMAPLWFATLLRDGFALAAAGDNARFGQIGADILHRLLGRVSLLMDPGQAVGHVMDGLSSLALHPDVRQGILGLEAGGYRLVTLSNGSSMLAERLFTDAGIKGSFERLLTVEDADAWKPAAASYAYASAACGVEPGRMLLVAVHPWDIHGASRAGLGTVWLNRTQETYPSYFTQPDLVIDGLADLAAALGPAAPA